MIEILFFLLGCGAGAAGIFTYVQVVHGSRRKADEQRYKTRWSEAVALLSSGGQLTEEQLKRILPSGKEEVQRLPRGVGFSEDRAATEIARAKAGLPPADNLKGMFSEDVAAVQQARIENGTAA